VDWFGATPTAWVLAGVGVVGVGVGVTMALVASNDYANANRTEGTILEAWTTSMTKGAPTDQSRFDKGTKPCSLPDDAVTRLNGDKSRVAQYAAACQQYSSRVSSGDTARTVAIVSGAVGAAALVGTVIYYFADRRTEPAKTAGSDGFRAHVIPWGGSGQMGVGVFGTF
jgi:hypothetical protein